MDRSQATATLSGAVNVKIASLTTTANNDIVLKSFIVGYDDTNS